MSGINLGYLGLSERLVPTLLRKRNPCNVPWIAVLVSTLPVVLAYMNNGSSALQDVSHSNSVSKNRCSKLLPSTQWGHLFLQLGQFCAARTSSLEGRSRSKNYPE